MDAASRAGYGDPEPNKSFKTYDRKRAQEAVDDGYTIDTRVERSGKRAYSTRSVYVNEEKRQGILRRKKQVVDYSRARFHRGGGFVDHGVNKSLAMPNTVSSTGDVAKSSQSAAVKNARLMLVAKGTVIQGPWDKPRPKGVRAAAGRLAKPRNLAEAALIGVAGGLVVNAASKLAAEYKRNPDEFKQTFRDQAARDRENKARWKANKTPMRQRIREVREQNSRPATTVGKSMPNTMAATGDVAKSNIREYPYLPEWVKDSFAATTVRNPLNATDLYAASRIMVQSQAAADGKRVRGRKLRRLTQAERRFAEGRMMLYSPLGRGAVTTG